MGMIDRDTLRQIRTDIATKMCIADPQLYRLTTSRFPPIFKNAEQRDRSKALKNLLDQEPSIRHILDYYAKRERPLHCV
jgi:hypothetical protein